MLGRLVIAAVALGLPAVPALPVSAAPHPDADYFEDFFPANDGFGTTLHADVLRPKGMPLTDKTPVILTVTPYANHSGSTTDAGFTRQPPNERFYDFLNLSQALKQGYTYAMVDLPGFGGSSGCNDWGGYREQTAVKAAVEWAAEQEWSTGKVALLGKSYDGWTGLMGISRKPKGLSAVISLEPVFSGYRYIYNNGVRFSSTAGTIALFQVIDAKPGSTNSSLQYHATGAPQAWCYGVNVALSSAMDDHNDPFWRERNLEISSTGSDVPVLLTQGLLETNTKPNGAFSYWNALDTTHSRAWFGQFDHCRGWETQSACTGSGNNQNLAVGREGFMDETMRFLDLHLKGIQPEVEDPKVVVQDNRAMYRAESQWPPEDMAVYWSGLNVGTYADDGTTTAGGNQQIWSFTESLEHDVWLSGEPRVTVEVSAPLPRANVVVDVFDVYPDGRARLINRGTHLLRDQGNQFVSFDLYGQDWRVPAGHRIGVVIAGTDAANGGFWLNVPTFRDVTVHQARIGLPFLFWERDQEEYLDGGMTPRLESHLGSTTNVASFIAGGEREFNLPPPLKQRPRDEEETGD